MKKYDPNIHHRQSYRLKGYDYSRVGWYHIIICCQDKIWRFGEVVNGEMVCNEFGQIAHQEWLNLPKRFPNFELDVFQIMPDHMHGIISLVETTVDIETHAGAGLEPAPNDGQPQGIAPTGGHPQGIAPTGGHPQGIAPTGGHPQGIAPTGGHPQGIAPTGGHPQGIAPTGGHPQGVAPHHPKVSDIVGAYKSFVANGCLKIYKSRNETMGKLWQRNYYERIIWDKRYYRNAKDYIIDNPIKWDGDKLHAL